MTVNRAKEDCIPSAAMSSLAPLRMTCVANLKLTR
jgi:hypothetical protein